MSGPKRVDVYLKPSCTSCRKALQVLEGSFELTKYDLAKHPPERALLERIVHPQRLDQFINTRSRSFKAAPFDLATISKDEAITRMLNDPNLMRRPLVIDAEENAVFGYEPEGWAELRKR